MKVFVLFGQKSRPSAKELAAVLRDGSNATVLAGTIVSKSIAGSDYLINVGTTAVQKFDPKIKIINHPSAVQVSANKRLARMRFKAKKIPAPALWLSSDNIPDCEFPVVGRTTFHMKASGFWYCKNKAEARAAERKGATHFLKFIKNTREFRAHVFSTCIDPKSPSDYIIAKLSEKRASEESDGTIIKNHDNGYKFLPPLTKDKEALEMVRAVAKETLHKFGLHFGGVDIMFSNSTRRVYVLEINSTPCLTDENSTTVEVYAEKLKGIMKVN